MIFHDTKMWHIHFEEQLPHLIQAIQAFANTIEKPNQTVTLPMEADPDFLCELYHGNYEPETFKRTPESDALTQSINTAHDKLLEHLSLEARKKLVKYQDALFLRDASEIQQAYESGYRTTVQMIVAGLFQPTLGQTNNTV